MEDTVENRAIIFLPSNYVQSIEASIPQLGVLWKIFSDIPMGGCIYLCCRMYPGSLVEGPGFFILIFYIQREDMSLIRRILIIDDDDDFLTAMRQRFCGVHKVFTARSTEEGLCILGREDIDLVLFDAGLDGGDEVEGIKKIHEVHPLVSIAMLSGNGDAKAIMEAIRSGAVDYLTKPVDDAELKEVIDRAVINHSWRERCEALFFTETSGKNGSGGIIYKSKAMRELIEQVKQLKGHNANILIIGETGTGKDLLARLIHQQEGEGKRPFVAVNCAAIPEHLLESELFGHEAGAFTGATRRRIGRFELADGGDIFLDEISTMKLDLQVKLLRVLQDGEFCRLGSNNPIQSSCRVISASNQPLDHLVETGGFRSDLYHRLRVIQLIVPPLRERVEDIPVLVEYFLDKFTDPSHKKNFTEAAIARLMEHSWPGNVRELANVVQSLTIMVKGNTICESDFPSWMFNGRHQNKNGFSHSNTNSSTEEYTTSGIGESIFSLKECVEAVERQHIERALQLYKYDKSKAASALGIGRTTLYTKMKNLGITK